MTGYYSHTLHTGDACDLRRREGVKGVKVLQVNRPGARIPHGRSEYKHQQRGCEGCRVVKGVKVYPRTRAHTDGQALNPSHPTHPDHNRRSEQVSILADVCPDCDSRSAAVPLSVEGDARGSLRAAYQCARGHQWTCWWDAESAGLPDGTGATP